MKKKRFPGSIYKPKNSNTLYIKLKGKRIATGLQATKENYKIAETILEKLFMNQYLPQQHLLTFIEGWEQYNSTLVNKSLKTVISYKFAFGAIIKKENYNNTINSKNIELLVIKYLQNTNHSKVAINIVLNQFQIFLNYLFSSEIIDKKIDMKKKYSYKLQKYNAKSYTDIELLKIYKYFYVKYIQIFYLIIFQVATGARMVDSLNLQWEDVDIKNRMIVWKNKITKLEEPRPASKLAFKILSRLRDLNSNKVFSWKYPYTRLNKYLEIAFKEIGIEQNGRSFQEFRVTFRMKLFRKGINKDLAQYLLRHTTELNYGDNNANLIDKYYTNYKEYNEQIHSIF
jgi:integrase